MKRLPEMKPDCRSGEGDKDNAKHLDKFKAMFVGESIRRFRKVNSGFGYFAQIACVSFWFTTDIGPPNS